MKAIMYGAGNIGRGFVGALLSQAGYRVSFVDVMEPVVRALQENERYPVRYVSTDGHQDVWIENVTAVNGNDAEAVSDAIAECDIMATAVGARILTFIAPNIAAGLRKRWQNGERPLNIIICENLMDANHVLEGLVKSHLTDEEKEIFDRTVGLVEASIGRMVPVQTDEMKDGEPLRVCVERYGFLPVDRDAFKGEIPEIPNMRPVAPFDFYINRKLYLHNMGHAVCAYLGGYLGMDYIWQAIDNPEILCIVQNAMTDSAIALSKKYGAPLSDLLMHVADLLERFRNRALMDTCQRVGGDPTRKLSGNDRLIGASRLMIETGMSPAFISIGSAGALYRYLNESGREQSAENAAAALREIAGDAVSDELFAAIMDMYAQFLAGESPAAMRRAAQNLKAKNLGNIV
ncbi:MAG: mannitol dehydrogenase [Clostridia bacterium]|nr:mannitol dehydrogenase [Clostridia bacterium]